MPNVFLSYTSNDGDLASKIANALNDSGINTFWDKWCIYPGDSLRQKIDEGLTNCSHFVVLLTPNSIQKPWVNQEMDAGLVLKLNNQCRFFPLRYNLPASALPPLLSAMFSPEISSDTDFSQLINDVYEISKKPPIGTQPQFITRSKLANTGYSPAATNIAHIFIERSKTADCGDPQIGIEDLSQSSSLSMDDTRDALYELESYFEIHKTMSRDWLILPKGSLFADFDRFWMPWDPAEDALRLSIDIQNDKSFPFASVDVAGRYDWTSRRLNSTIHYLFNRGLIEEDKNLGSYPFSMSRIISNEAMRRFIKNQTI